MSVKNDLEALLNGGIQIDWGSSRFSISRALDLIKTMLFSGSMTQVPDSTLPENFIGIAWSEGVPDPEDAPFLWVYEGTDVWVARNDGVIDLTQASAWYRITSNSPTTTQGDIIYRGASVDQRLPIGSEDSDLVVSGGVPSWVNRAIVILRDEKTSGTAGGTATSGDWLVRALNTEVTDEGNHATLSNNQVTLVAGTYEIAAEAPAFRVGRHQIRWYNVTDDEVLVLGMNAQCSTTNGSTTNAVLTGRFTIALSKTFELQHRVYTTKSVNGFGLANSWGTEVYSTVTLRKIK